MGFIIAKRKEFGTTNNLPRVGRPAIPRASVRGETKNPMVTLVVLQTLSATMEGLAGRIKKSQKHSVSSTFMLEWLKTLRKVAKIIRRNVLRSK